VQFHCSPLFASFHRCHRSIVCNSLAPHCLPPSLCNPGPFVHLVGSLTNFKQVLSLTFVHFSFPSFCAAAVSMCYTPPHAGELGECHCPPGACARVRADGQRGEQEREEKKTITHLNNNTASLRLQCVLSTFAAVNTVGRNQTPTLFPLTHRSTLLVTVAPQASALEYPLRASALGKGPDKGLCVRQCVCHFVVVSFAASAKGLCQSLKCTCFLTRHTHPAHRHPAQ
jgi:hypothetical protein